MERHTVEYKVLNESTKPADAIRHWNVEAHATAEELEFFAESGYLVREELFKGSALTLLRSALDRLEEKETRERDRQLANEKSWGYIPRRLMDKEQVFLDLLKFEPTLSIARAMMGPLLRIRGFSGRIGYPANEYRHETPWHQHLTVISDPLPPWFSRPHCIDCLIYLDDLDEKSGAICVVPGSHNWLDKTAPQIYEPVPGELQLRVKAGSVVMIHGNLWHRALPTVSKRRRTLLLSYTPAWLRKSPHKGPKLKNGLVEEYIKDADYESRILLGAKEYY